MVYAMKLILLVLQDIIYYQSKTLSLAISRVGTVHKKR